MHVDQKGGGTEAARQRGARGMIAYVVYEEKETHRNMPMVTQWTKHDG